MGFLLSPEILASFFLKIERAQQRAKKDEEPFHADREWDHGIADVLKNHFNTGVIGA